MNVSRKISSELSKRSFPSRTLSIDHVIELRDEIERLYQQKLISQDLYEKEIQVCLNFNKDEALSGARSILIVAFPSPQIKASFVVNGEKHVFTIPPYYADWEGAIETIQAIVNPILQTGGYSVVKADLPEKMLAVYSGLGAYGRNNLSYIKGLGSFHCLSAFYGDFEYTDDSWQEVTRLKACENCRLCINSCPSGAITGDRFLINAERCLTFYNEGTGIFPQWIESGWHNCLVGCNQCQVVCPANSEFVENNEIKAEFTAEETDYILNDVPVDSLPREFIMKLDQVGLKIYYSRLLRNLKALLGN